MSSKPTKFFSPPSILVQIAIPNSKKKQGLRDIHALARSLKLKSEIKEQRPDENFPGATYFAFRVMPNFQIKTPQQLVEASQNVTKFSALFQTTIMVQNMPENIQ